MTCCRSLPPFCKQPLLLAGLPRRMGLMQLLCRRMSTSQGRCIMWSWGQGQRALCSRIQHTSTPAGTLIWA